jgi:C1A family cysteine protease
MISINDLNEQLQVSSVHFWTAQETPLFLLNTEERKKRLGVVVNTLDHSASMSLRAQAAAPNFQLEVDWRNRNGNHVTAIKDQGGCGSCVSFCSVATIES